MSLFLFLALACVGCNQPSNSDRSEGDPLFTKLSSDDTKVAFNNTLDETIEKKYFAYDYLYNGAGVAAGDINNDGLTDLYFVGNTAPNKLYLNKGNFVFTDVSEISGVTGKSGWRTGVSLMDVNGDGKLDIYICHAGLGEGAQRANELFVNNGNNAEGVPTFTERAKELGIDAPGTYTTQANFFDYDLDGDLDLFLLNHGIDYDASLTGAMQNSNVRHPEYGNRLYRHDANHFTEVSDSAGINGGWLNYGLSCSIADFNADGYPDLYVSNDFDERDFLYMNNGNGTFTESLKASFGHISKYTMGSDAADINNDLWPDLVTVDMLPDDNHRKKLLKGPDDFDHYNFFASRGYHYQQMRNMLQIHRGLDAQGKPVFSEVGQLAGISSTDWSWTSLFADFDNDGQKDLFITNGYYRDLTNMDFNRYDFETARQNSHREGKDPKTFVFDLVSKMPPIRMSNYIYRNKNGTQFENKTKEWGLYEPLITTGSVYADLDNDGDLDLATSNINDLAGIYRNNSDAQFPKRHFLRVKLEGEGSNPYGIGSKVYVAGKNRTQYVEAYTVRGYLSTVDHALHFGLGEDSVLTNVKVLWPDGRVSILNNPGVDTTILITQLEAQAATPEKANVVTPLLSDVTRSMKIDFKHQENSYIDFKYERLVFSMLSRQGPRVAVGDVNGDGNDDFFVGGAIGYSGRLYLGKTGAFTIAESQPWEADKASEDTGVLFADVDGDKDLDLFVVSGGCEQKPGAPELNDRIYLNNGRGKFQKAIGALPEVNETGSCVTAADYDKDGDLDIFVGGWSLHSAYPNATPSRLFRNDSERAKGVIKFTDITPTACPALKDAGLTTDAIWVDVDNNGWLDLIVVGQWSPIRIYKNDQGVLKLSDGLEKTNGFWNRVLSGDFDGDGDVDLIAGNLGLNGEFKAGEETPLQLFYDDFDKNGQVDPICAYYENGKLYPVATRDDLISQLPSLKKKFLRYEQFADATMSDVLSPEQLKASRVLSAYNLESVMLKNDGEGKFSVVSLPLEVQYAPVQGILAHDLDGDSKPEVVISGNLHTYRVEYGPFDASNGTVLRFTQTGIETVPSPEVGVRVYGDTRDLQVLHDSRGEAYFIVTRNNGELQFLRVNGNIGRRLKLSGGKQ